MKTKNKIVSIILAFSLIIALFPANVFAAESKMLSVNWNHISSVGKQPTGSDACACYSLAYARTILDGYVHTWGEYDYNGYTSGTYDVYNARAYWSLADYSAKYLWDAQSVYKKAYDSINAGRPFIIYVSGTGSKQHYVTVIGYENVTDSSSLSASNFLITDSVPNTVSGKAENLAAAGYGLKMTDSGYKYAYTENGSAASSSASSAAEKPSNVYLRQDKSTAVIGENVTFTFGADGASSYEIYIYSKGSQIEHKTFSKPQSYSRVFTAAGTYGIVAGASNANGYTQSNYIEITIKPEESKTYTVQFTSSDGSTVLHTVTASEGEYITIPQGPPSYTAGGVTYEFVGWYLSGDPERKVQTAIKASNSQYRAKYAAKKQNASFSTYDAEQIAKYLSEWESFSLSETDKSRYAEIAESVSVLNAADIIRLLQSIR